MFRPATNCDDESVVKLRAFFKGYDFSNKQSGSKVLAENSVPLTLEEIKDEMLKEINPRSTKLLRELNDVFAVAEALDTKEVMFYASVDCFSESTGVGMMPAVVPCERYTSSVQLGKLTPPEYQGSQDTVQVSIRCGDVVRLPYLHRFTATSQAPTKAVSPDGWYKITEVDVIFARIRIIVVPAPPECWISTSSTAPSSSSSVLIPFWVPIANFWNILVCRNSAEQISSRKAKEGTILSYNCFLTPLEADKDSLAFLSYQPTVQKVFTVPRDVESDHVIVSKVLQTTSTSVVLAWNLYPKLADGKLGKCLHSDCMKDLFFTVLVCPPLDVHWHQIYRGTGEACQISALLPLQQYQIKIDAKSPALKAAVRYIHITTLAAAPTSAPDVDEWFIGAKLGTVRFQIFVSREELRSDLPSGCVYVFECTVQETHVPEDADRNQLNPLDDLFASTTKLNMESFKVHHCGDIAPPEEDKWTVVGKCRCGNISVVIPMREFWNPVIFLRIRISNQEGMFSDPSPSRIIKLMDDT